MIGGPSGIYWIVSVIHIRKSYTRKSCALQSTTGTLLSNVSVFSYIKLYILFMFWIMSLVIYPQRVCINIIKYWICYYHIALKKKMFSVVTIFNEKQNNQLGPRKFKLWSESWFCDFCIKLRNSDFKKQNNSTNEVRCYLDTCYFL